MTDRTPPTKSADAYRTIGEVADDLKIPQHVLRFWETRFPQVKPLKRAGGRRFYHPEDVALLQAIKALLYGEGYTIKGVQRLLQDQGPKAVAAAWAAMTGPPRSPPRSPERIVVPPAGNRATDAAAGRRDSRDDAMRDEEPLGVDDRPGSGAAPPTPSGTATASPHPPSTKLTGTVSGELVRRLDAVARELFECGRLLAGARGAKD